MMTRVARASTYFFHQVTDASPQKKYLIVAVALAAISLVALMAICYRRMPIQNQIKNLDKNDKQQIKPIAEKELSKPIDEKKPNNTHTAQPGLKNDQQPTKPIAERELSKPDDSADKNAQAPNDAVINTPALQQNVNKKVRELEELGNQLQAFQDYQDPSTPERNKLHALDNLYPLFSEETKINASIDNAEYYIRELSAWKSDHTYIIKPNSLDNWFLGDDQPRPPELSDLIPLEIEMAHSSDQREEMVNETIEHYTKIREQSLKSKPEIEKKINDAKNMLPLIREEARKECFERMRAVSSEFGKLFTGIPIGIEKTNTLIRWNPSDNTFYQSVHGMVQKHWEEIASPETLQREALPDAFPDDPIDYVIDLNTLEDLMFQLQRRADYLRYNELNVHNDPW